MVKIAILRKSGFTGVAVAMNCYINNNKVCRLKENDTSIIEVDEEVYEFYCNLTMNPKSDIIELDVLNNKFAEVIVESGLWKPKVKIQYSNEIPEKYINMGCLNKFNPTKKIGNYIFFDDINKLWTIPTSFGKISGKIYRCEDILEYELLENGESITKGGLGSAIAGGLLFGGVGAIVGGVTGKKKNKNIVNSMQIKITLNNKENPVEYIKLISTEVNTSSFIYKTTKDIAEQILSMLVIIEREIQNKNSEIINTANISIADEIKKYKELLDIGAITEEEYKEKKSQLLKM